LAALASPQTFSTEPKGGENLNSDRQILQPWSTYRLTYLLICAD